MEVLVNVFADVSAKKVVGGLSGYWSKLLDLRASTLVAEDGEAPLQWVDSVNGAEFANSEKGATFVNGATPIQSYLEFTGAEFFTSPESQSFGENHSALSICAVVSESDGGSAMGTIVGMNPGVDHSGASFGASGGYATTNSHYVCGKKVNEVTLQAGAPTHICWTTPLWAHQSSNTIIYINGVEAPSSVWASCESGAPQGPLHIGHWDTSNPMMGWRGRIYSVQAYADFFSADQAAAHFAQEWVQAIVQPSSQQVVGQLQWSLESDSFSCTGASDRKARRRAALQLQEPGSGEYPFDIPFGVFDSELPCVAELCGFSYGRWELGGVIIFSDGTSTSHASGAVSAAPPRASELPLLPAQERRATPRVLASWWWLVAGGWWRR
ncbi:hypothetical protein CYMTET_56988 [Cymbomonas tetramitiformis]|uniref:Uncharacterized protein n=1 Tax=Cymbomonas tetramitiformis TaxID=36881 RepID=A0AAE0BA81_9CHLO|nr:hypothetical protein CYMTET_56988 [Cymbomonas tetramitiformis]